MNLSREALFLLIPLAAIGGACLAYWAFLALKTAWMTLKKLNEALNEAVAFLKEHRADLQAVRQMETIFAQTTGQNTYVQTPPITWNPPPAPPPAPPYDLFRKPPEPDSDREEVDVTASDSELAAAESTEKLAEMGYGRPDPEFKPQAVEANSD